MSKKNGKLVTAVRREMRTGPVDTVKVRVKRVISENYRNSIPEQPGNFARGGKGRKGRKLSDEIKIILGERCKIKRENGQFLVSTRFHQVALAFVEQMEAGEIAFFKEYLERTEGKVATTVQNPDGTPVKMYAPFMLKDGQHP